MAQYIDKAAVVAEIERRIDELYDMLPDTSKVENGIITISEACNSGKYTALESFKDYLDTIEVKETPDSADLEEEIENELERTWCGEYLDTDKFKESAVYFFELGLKAQKGD